MKQVPNKKSWANRPRFPIIKGEAQMARTMTPREFAETVYILRMSRDLDARRALAAMGEEPVLMDYDGAAHLGVYLLDDQSHDMNILKFCGFLICPEVDL